MRKVAFDSIYLNHLKNKCNIPTVTKVACHEMAGCNMMFVIQLDRPAIGQPWQALRAATAFDASLGKYFIAVDSDIELRKIWLSRAVNGAKRGYVCVSIGFINCAGHRGLRVPRDKTPANAKGLFWCDPVLPKNNQIMGLVCIEWTPVFAGGISAL